MSEAEARASFAAAVAEGRTRVVHVGEQAAPTIEVGTSGGDASGAEEVGGRDN